MNIYTSYFARVSKLPESIVPISIAARQPPGVRLPECKKLAPSWSILSEWKRTQDSEQYVARFNDEVLSKINQEAIRDELKQISRGKDVALICYERPEAFCHRHLVAQWLGNVHEYATPT